MDMKNILKYSKNIIHDMTIYFRKYRNIDKGLSFLSLLSTNRECDYTNGLFELYFSTISSPYYDNNKLSAEVFIEIMSLLSSLRLEAKEIRIKYLLSFDGFRNLITKLFRYIKTNKCNIILGFSIVLPLFTKEPITKQNDVNVQRDLIKLFGCILDRRFLYDNLIDSRKYELNYDILMFCFRIVAMINPISHNQSIYTEVLEKGIKNIVYPFGHTVETFHISHEFDTTNLKLLRDNSRDIENFCLEKSVTIVDRICTEKDYDMLFGLANFLMFRRFDSKYKKEIYKIIITVLETDELICDLKSMLIDYFMIHNLYSKISIQEKLKIINCVTKYIDINISISNPETERNFDAEHLVNILINFNSDNELFSNSIETLFSVMCKLPLLTEYIDIVDKVYDQNIDSPNIAIKIIIIQNMKDIGEMILGIMESFCAPKYNIDNVLKNIYGNWTQTDFHFESFLKNIISLVYKFYHTVFYKKIIKIDDEYNFCEKSLEIFKRMLIDREMTICDEETYKMINELYGNDFDKNREKLFIVKNIPEEIMDKLTCEIAYNPMFIKISENENILLDYSSIHQSISTGINPYTRKKITKDEILNFNESPEILKKIEEIRKKIIELACQS
jgi:hypothetical protein